MPRAFTLAARRRGPLAAATVHAALATACLWAWGGVDRVPFLRGADLYAQLLTVQAGFMAIAAPWLTARIAWGDSRDEIPRLSHQYGVEAALMSRQRLGAALAWTVLVQLAGLPVAIEAQQMTATDPATALTGQLAVLAIGICSAALSWLAAMRTDSGMVQWLAPAAGVVAALVVLA